jgi:hypothetical protein
MTPQGKEQIFNGTIRLIILGVLLLGAWLVYGLLQHRPDTSQPDSRNLTAVQKRDVEDQMLTDRFREMAFQWVSEDRSRYVAIISLRHGLEAAKVQAVADFHMTSEFKTDNEIRNIGKERALEIWGFRIRKLAESSGLSEKEVATVLWDLYQIREK